MSVKKAVIPAAGLGTRMLPISKSIPKEMFPIVDKPAIQFLVEEAVDAGITDILIITSRGKEAIESHFDYSPDYESSLEKKGKLEELSTIRKIANLANVYFIRQKEMRGLGHAVLCAREFIGNDPFAVLYGDDVCISKTPVVKQLMNVSEKYGDRPVVGVKEVTREQVKKYCSLKVENLCGNEYQVFDMIEKPKTDAEVFSLYSILGRVLLTPDIFDILEKTAPGAGNEIQLTDAMRGLIGNKLYACDFEGIRHDIGNKFGLIKANIDEGLKHPETSEQLKAYIKELSGRI